MKIFVVGFSDHLLSSYKTTRRHTGGYLNKQQQHLHMTQISTPVLTLWRLTTTIVVVPHR